MKRFVASCFLTLGASLWAAASYAIVVSIDEFSITRDGSSFFTDTFNALGGGPPTGPNSTPPNYNPAFYGPNRDTPLGYHVLDKTTSGPTSGTTLSTAGTGSVLPMDTANGASTANAEGAARREVAVTLLTSVASTTAPSALTSSNTLTATGLFDLFVPTGPLFSAYGIRFSDHLPNANPPHPDGQLLQLFVRFNDTTGTAEIAYILQDFGVDMITLLGSIDLLSAIPSGADQIQFTLSQNTAGGGFLGSYEFFDGGVDMNSGGTLGSGSLFNDTNFQFVRGQFFVAEAIPEPGTLALLGLGLAGLAAARRRKQ